MLSAIFTCFLCQQPYNWTSIHLHFMEMQRGGVSLHVILTFHSVLTTMQEREGLSRWRQEPQDWYQPAPLLWVLVNTEKWDSRRYSSITCVMREGRTAEGSTSIRMDQDAGWGGTETHNTRKPSQKVFILQSNHLRSAITILKWKCYLLRI